MRLAVYTPSVAMAIYAHPDDADVAAGGLLALWASMGASVHLVVLCDGSKGSHLSSDSTLAVAQTRREELLDAAALLGIRQVHCLDYPDGEMSNDVTLRSSLVGLIREFRPVIVVAPDPTATFFGGVYVNHRDHREAGWAVLDTVAPAAAMPLYFPAQGPAHRVETLLLSGTHEPDVAVAIEPTIAAKVAAVLAHRSQMGDDAEGIAEVVRSRAAQAGRPVGVAYAEAFRSVELDA